jgi:lipoprotein-anchoring transpeptidase ErfK/SrfK
VLDVVNKISVATAPNLPGLGYPDRFLPAPDRFATIHLVLKLGERRVYVYQKDQVQASFPVAIGRSGWETPTGSYQVIQMQHDPVWQHPFTGEVVPPGAENPLGVRWIGFWTDGTNYIGFHGTPNEESVGRPASHGCVRMYNRDVVKLFEMVRLGTPVSVVP